MNISEIGELYQIPKVGFSENEIIRAEQNIGVQGVQTRLKRNVRFESK